MKNITLLVALFSLTIGFAQNNSIQFDGIDDHIELGDHYGFNLSMPFAVEAWIKTGQIGLAQIVSKLSTDTGDFRGWGLQVSSTGQLEAYVSSAFFTNKRYFRGTQFIADDVWHHVAMVYDGGEDILLYVDGVIDPISGTGHDGATLGAFDTSAPTHIGNYEGSGSPDEYFFGNIDEVRIWNEVRSTAEIAANWNTELSGTEANLLGYYKMDNTASTCDIEDCNASETHGSREGTSGADGLPQFSTEVPVLTDVACGATTNCALGNDDIAYLEEITFYPMPAQDELHINGLRNLNETYSLYNTEGKLVQQGAIQQDKINLESIPTGLYFITIQSNETSITKKVIKQ